MVCIYGWQLTSNIVGELIAVADMHQRKAETLNVKWTPSLHSQVHANFLNTLIIKFTCWNSPRKVATLCLIFIQV
jgi:hypothetical protein